MSETGLRLAFVVPWREPGRWIWERLEAPHTGKIVSLAGGRSPFVGELRAALRQRALLRGVDVVFAWELRSIVAVGMVRRLARNDPARFVAVGPIVKGVTARAQRVLGPIFADASRVVCFSRAEASQFPQRWGIAPERVSFAPVPWPESPPSGRDDGVAVAVGRSARDLPTLVAALERASVPAVVVSGAAPPPGLGSTVAWKGPLPGSEVTRLLEACRLHALALQPVEHSCGQSVLVRAMMAGKPSVVTDVRVLDDYATADTAVRVPAGNPEAMAEAIRALWDDPAHRAAMGEAAHRRALTFGYGPFCHRMTALAAEAMG